MNESLIPSSTTSLTDKKNDEKCWDGGLMLARSKSPQRGALRARTVLRDSETINTNVFFHYFPVIDF